MTDHIVFTTEDPAFLDADTGVEVRETYSLGTAPHAAALVHQGKDGVLDALTDRANLALDERVAAVHAEFDAHLQTAPTDNAGNEINVSENATDVATIDDVHSLHSVPDNDRTGAGTTAVVMDTGIDPSHKAVPDTVKWVDVTDNPTDGPTDVVGHGTAVAGQISRLASNTSLIGLRIFGSESSTSGRAIMRAYDWLFKNADQLDVINMSWGASKRIPELDKTHDALIELGVRGVVAAGNSGKKGGSPATADKAFSVGAVTEDGTLAKFSSYNPKQDNPDVCAIGKDCQLAQASGTNMATNLDGPWIKASGTSFSAPAVVGMVAKLLSGDTSVAPPKITSVFESEAADIPATSHDGAGIAKYRAMRNAVGNQSDQSDQPDEDTPVHADHNTTSRIDHLEDRIERLESEKTASVAQATPTETSPRESTDTSLTPNPGGESRFEQPTDTSDYESGKHKRHGIHFDRIVNAVDDLGWDSSGNETIDMPEKSNTLIEIPNGTYQTGHNVFFGIENFGLVGIGDNVTFKPPVSKCLRAIHVSSNDPGRNILVENIEFNQRAGLEAGLGLNITVHDGLEIRHCKRTGMTPNRNTAGPPHGKEIIGLSATIRNEGGHGTITHWTDHCETRVISYPGNAQGISVWDASKGTLTIRDSSIRNQGEHALYGSKASAVEVIRCEFIDNANTNCRLAGEGSFAEDSRFGYQREASYTDHHNEPGRKATKILRSEDARDGASGGYYHNCEFFCETDGLTASMVVFIMGNLGGVTFENCLLRNDSNNRGAVIQAIGEGWRKLEPPGAKWVHFNNCRFEGNSENPPVEANRDEVELNNCTIDMSRAPAPQGI